MAAKASEERFVDFVEVHGEKEFSSRLVARPLHGDSEAGARLDAQELAERQARARDELADYRVVMRLHQIEEYVFEVPAGAVASFGPVKIRRLGNVRM